MKRLIFWLLFLALGVLYSLTVYGWWVQGNGR